MGRVFRRTGSASKSNETSLLEASTQVTQEVGNDGSSPHILPEISSFRRLSSSLKILPDPSNLHPSNTHQILSSTAPLPSSSSFLPSLSTYNNNNNNTIPSKSRGSFRMPSTVSSARIIPTPPKYSTMEVGLENLGNSCFMNSSLQCLLHIEPLISYFLSGNHITEINENSPSQGKLATVFSQLVKEMSEARDGSVISPINFFKQLRTLAPHLIDYQQQDSQEFLRFVLDGLCEDLCRRKPTSEAVITRRKSAQLNKDQLLSSDRASFKGSRLDSRDSQNRNSFRRNGSTLQTPLLPAKWLPDSTEDRVQSSVTKSASGVGGASSGSPVAVTRLFADMSLGSCLRPEVDAEGEEPILPSPLSKIAEEANRSWDSYMKFNDSFVADLFAGQLQSTVSCLTCKTKSYSFDPFLDLAVPIPAIRNPESKMTMTGRLRGRLSVEIVRCSLEECLQNFTSEEVLEGENMIMCDHCKEKRSATKRLSLYRLPKILVIQIKRFRTGKASREKLNTDVVFPLSQFDVSPFLSSSDGSAEDKSSTSSGSKYDLIGISHHSGTMHGGHYVATIDINNNKDGVQKWVNFNDGIVTTVPSSSLSGPSAYVLFYKMNETKRV